MAGWTQANIDALKAAMAMGIKRVRYTDGETEYQSIAEMQALLVLMTNELNAATASTRRVARVERGF